jgi:hypothetical protein
MSVHWKWKCGGKAAEAESIAVIISPDLKSYIDRIVGQADIAGFMDFPTGVRRADRMSDFSV